MRQEVIDVRLIDWNRVWQTRRSRRSSPRRDTDFWDGRAISFAKSRAESGYADLVLAIMSPRTEWTVLDMGCGSGVLTIPLAQAVTRVTAVDMSKEMLAAVRARCEDKGIDNVVTLQGRWEDDWEKLGIEVHDVAIASRSMVTEDLRSSVLKLNGAARKQVYIVTVVGDGPYDRRLFEAIGRPLNAEPDYIYNYNMLYQMGILANVALIEEPRNRAYESPQEAFESVQWMFGGLNPREEERLRAYVGDHLVFSGGCWKFSYDRVIRWAVIWWKKG